jgi:hypothetical protein
LAPQLDRLHGTWRSLVSAPALGQPQESAVQSGISAGSAPPFPAESGGVSRPGWLIRRPRIRSETRPVRLVLLWSIAAGRVGFGVQLVGPKRRLFNDWIAIGDYQLSQVCLDQRPLGDTGCHLVRIPDVVPSLSRSDDPTMRDFELRLPGQDLDLSSPVRPNQHQAQACMALRDRSREPAARRFSRGSTRVAPGRGGWVHAEWVGATSAGPVALSGKSVDAHRSLYVATRSG